YYISPQIWAWRGGRIGTIKRYVDKMLVILPFEENYYRERGMDAEFVGHPILEDFSIQGDRAFFQKKLGLDPSRPTVALLPGSRQKEVGYILPVLLQASLHLVSRRPVQFVVSVAPSVRKCQVEAILDQIIPRELKDCFRMSFDPSRDVLAHSDFAFVKSGTSTLEAALVGVPFLVTYRLSRLSWWIGSVLIQTPMKGLVNLIAGDEIVPELYQNAATPEALANVALGYLNDPAKSLALRERLSSIRERLGSRHASETAAAAVSGYL
ncbi:MAG: lipid-A-disaccharide synthase, partial [Rectinema sp.]|nr:lipid-A-disaccharide synthase [Rectinema sp.]